MYLIYYYFVYYCPPAETFPNREKTHPEKPVEEVLTYVGSEETIADTMLFKQASVFTFEATDESLIGRIERIAKLEGNYYVLDRQTNRVLVFDNEGRYLRTIGRIGGGEGEYASLRDMAIDTYDQKIWLIFLPTVKEIAPYCYSRGSVFAPSRDHILHATTSFTPAGLTITYISWQMGK